VSAWADVSWAAGQRCERETWCTAPATRAYVRTDWPHYHPGDDRAEVPIETMRTCEDHPMGDGQEGRPDYGWRREPPDPGEIIAKVARHM
jgi:hypothetical protein